MPVDEQLGAGVDDGERVAVAEERQRCQEPFDLVPDTVSFPDLPLSIGHFPLAIVKPHPRRREPSVVGD